MLFKVSTLILKVLGKLNVCQKKKLKSLEHRWEKNFEIVRQTSIRTDVLYRSIPLGVPVTTKSQSKSDKADREIEFKQVSPFLFFLPLSLSENNVNPRLLRL